MDLLDLIGIVVRDYKEVVLTRRTTSKNFLLVPIVVEALVAFYAIELVERWVFLVQFWKMMPNRL